MADKITMYEITRRFERLLREYGFPATSEFLDLFPGFRAASRYPLIFPVRISNEEEHAFFFSLFKALVNNGIIITHDIGAKLFSSNPPESTPYCLFFINVVTLKDAFTVRTSTFWWGRTFQASEVMEILASDDFMPSSLVATTPIGNEAPKGDTKTIKEDKIDGYDENAVVRSIFL